MTTALMTPRQYMGEIVLPTLREYEETTNSRRRAYLACIVVYHLVDYLKKAGSPDPADVMRKSCSKAWRVVHAVATAAKHGDNDDKRNLNPLKFWSGTDDFRPPAVAGEFECGWSELGDVDGSIVIPTEQTHDPEYENVLDALKTVIHHYQLNYGLELTSD